jgi:hypothetical protein
MASDREEGPGEGVQVARTAVSRSSDFRRIEALPRRDWKTAPDLDRLVVLLTRYLKTPGGTQELRRVQAAAIREIYDVRGMVGFIPVGEGKTLISLLAPVVIGAVRPLLIIPADLRDKTKAELPSIRLHWRLHPNLEIRSYEELSTRQRAEELWEIRPDMILMDEGHRAGNPKAAVVRRVDRYKKDFPTTIIVVMSGTLSSRSLREYWHLMKWALGDRLCPLPLRWPELTDWADAIDEKVTSRAAPGALVRFSDGAEDLESVRRGFQRRLIETPGVISGEGADVKSSLRIHGVHFAVPPVVQGFLRELRHSWQDPNGDPLFRATDVWRIARQLACGFWLRWDPPAPPDWLAARQAWGIHVRHVLRHNRRGLDTEKQVWDECEANNGPMEFLEWRQIRPAFKPNPVPEWIHDFALVQAAAWLERHKQLVWVGHPAFGGRLEAMTGVPFFGGGDRRILSATGPGIASIAAHHKGKNLQHQWCKNYVVAPPSKGSIWEQLIGRTHRPGQPADEVAFWINQHVEELSASFAQARADAEYIEQTQGSRQKLNYADILIRREVLG